MTARISLRDVSQKNAPPFSKLKFENEAALFREIILQDRVNYLSGKGDKEDGSSGWFDPEGHDTAKLIAKRRDQLARMATFSSGPKDRLFAGEVSVGVEIRHKEKLSITIGDESPQRKGPVSGF